MLILRLVGMLVALVVGAGIVAFLFSRDRRYLRLSWRVAKYALILTLVIMALFLLERVVVL
jgi:nucleoside permease NupC